VSNVVVEFGRAAENRRKDNAATNLSSFELEFCRLIGASD
jgi:hypothetical protein